MIECLKTIVKFPEESDPIWNNNWVMQLNEISPG